VAHCAPIDMSSLGISSFIRVLAFVLKEWRRQRLLLSCICGLVLLQTLADVLVPLYAGRLIDALSPGRADLAAQRDDAITALGYMVALALVTVACRHVAFLGVVRFTLTIMSHVAQQTFWRVQRFSSDWHANNFAGSTVRKITRGMWGFDLLNDTLLVALLGSFAVLVGTSALLAWHWPWAGILIGACAAGYVGLTLSLSLVYVAPAARLSNSCDTKLGGALADAIS
jgi:ATP-binding cassette, subfamily B, bacterial